MKTKLYLAIPLLICCAIMLAGENVTVAIKVIAALGISTALNLLMGFLPWPKELP